MRLFKFSFFIFFITGCSNPKISDIEECWVAISGSSCRTILLRTDGKANLAISGKWPSSETQYITVDGNWGLSPMGASFLMTPKKVEVKRYIWISFPSARFDFADLGDKVLEIDKMGIQTTYEKAKFRSEF